MTPNTTEPQPAGRPSWLTRVKLTEPVRLYLWALAGVLAAGCVLAGWVTQDWADWLLALAGAVLGVGGTGEVVRASVYSPRGALQAVRSATWQAGGAVVPAQLD